MARTMRLNKDQRNAIRYNENTLIIACPGSGKTRTLIAKLLHCLDEVRDTSRKITCLTYTNAAVYEIENRLRAYGESDDEDYCDISTIHSFCLTNILSNFFWRIDEYSGGFSVISPEDERFQEIAKYVLAEYSLPDKFVEYFEQLNREPDGTPIVPQDIPPEVACAFWERLQHEGLIDFPNIIYYAFRLLSERPSIAHALACRYSWFLVDEFQDTSALQVEIFRIIASYGITKFFLVGDPYQSIFGFAGAQVELMEEFGHEISASSEFPLTGNYRCSNRIIEHAEILLPRKPRMKGLGETANADIEPIYVHTATAFEAITDYFLPAIEGLKIPYGKAAILSPWWIKLYQLGRSLRDYGIPIVGPGARPYKRTHMFAILAEQVCAYISYPTRETFHQIEKELFYLITGATGKKPYGIFTYSGNVTTWKLITCGNAIYQKNRSAVEWLRNAAKEFEKILYRDELLPKSCEEILKNSAEDIIEDLIKNKVDIKNLSTEDLGVFASTERNLHLLTMHRAKGREFDAVAIVDLHEGKIPHYRTVQSGDLVRIEEDKRLLYVAITRARRFLMYVTDEENRKNIPSRFICDEFMCLPRYN